MLIGEYIGVSKQNLSNIKTDFIIVGQGLAGTILAMKLIRSGHKVLVIDKAEMSTSSKVAAGIWNPVVFKRLTKSWLADDLLPELNRFYKEQEFILGTKLISQTNIIKLFTEQQEANLWQRKANDEMAAFLEAKHYQDTPIIGINYSEAGYSKVLQSGYLQIKLYLDVARQFLIDKESYVDERFDFNELEVGSEVKYKQFSSPKIIFAEGYLIKNNPFFNYLPFKPAKGEVITISSVEVGLKNEIVNKGGFILPLTDNEFKVGATYNWDDLTDKPTQAGLEDLKSKASKLCAAEYHILKHEAGVRPSVIDRRPVLGVHPLHKNLYVFNGLGTKGVMLAPFFAEHLLNHILSNSPLNKEVDIIRFSKFYSN